MKKIFLLMYLFLAGCATAPYHLKVRNDLANDHGKSVYFRTSMRSTYAMEIRRALSEKLAEIGLKTATSAENADLIAIFDIETFYRQNSPYKNTSYVNTSEDAVLFSDNEEANSLDFSGNANYVPTTDQTCFSLNIGPKATSYVKYNSMFCANKIMEPEQMLPLVLNVYEQYATYQYASIGLKCSLGEDGTTASCQSGKIKRQSYIDIPWLDNYLGN